MLGTKCCADVTMKVLVFIKETSQLSESVNCLLLSLILLKLESVVHMLCFEHFSAILVILDRDFNMGNEQLSVLFNKYILNDINCT